MKTFYATRDSEGIRIRKIEPVYIREIKRFSVDLESLFMTKREFNDFFGLTLAMNECKRVKIRLEVVK